ncbi:uncharacterized protein LOC112126105 [Cimex lectularius]|uniref:Chitin-binding type-2 domain-containing protein n=1 Tax=Cimex lectularius TaxID=79782 RepID=A0A8I6RMG3_CIMLE|nr:uncharacterized protein LOC112126105 [Cimex lectularius]
MWSVIAAFIGLCALANSNMVQVNCPKTGIYIHVMPSANCKLFYVCTSGTVIILECPPDTMFSSEEKKCKASGECRELVCAGRIDGIYADPIENCTRVYKCTAGKVSHVHTCAKDGAQCSEIEKENNCPEINYSTALILRKRDICKTRTNDLYALKDCSRYVKCLDGKEVSLKTCPSGRKFNGTLCVENYECGNICTAKEDGFYADEEAECQQYVSCKNQLVKSRHQCPSGTVYDGSSCIVSSTNVCPSFKKCQGKQDADYFRNCSSYFECSNEAVIYEKSCPDGENFNGTNCVPQNMFFCQGPNLSPDCLGKNGFFFNQYSGCNAYHFCAFGNKLVFRCPENHIFNGKRCVLKNQFQCPNKTNLCEEKFDGHNHDMESKCLMYQVCFEDDLNKHLVTLPCPQGEIFNGQECVKPSMIVCPYKDKECKNKSDGYYTYKLIKENYFCKNSSKLMSKLTLKCGTNSSGCNFYSHPENICLEVKKGYLTDTKCRMYYVCTNYSLTSYGKCEPTHVFNGETCVDSNSFQCPAQSKSCQGLINGFYQDIDSGRKKYFFCLNGVKTEFSCPEGKVHNEDVWELNNNFKCTTFLSRPNFIHVT